MLRPIRPFLLVLLLLLPASVIHAAPLVDVSWSVAGGSFFGPFSFGPVTGGTVSFTPTVPVSTPVFAAGLWSVSLTQSFGPGTFMATWSAAFPVTIVPGTVAQFPVPAVLGFIGSGGFTGGLITAAPPSFGFFASPGVGAGAFVGGIHIYGAFTHSFTVLPGSEVRTFVPEPATGSLVGLGLVIMGVVGGGRRAARRARRA